MFRVLGSDTYLNEISRWPKIDLEAVEKITTKLAENPYAGKPLSRSFLREKRIGGKRIYYLIYDDLKLVLLAATSGKKDQQETIDHIKEQLKEFRSLAEKMATLNV